MCGVRIKDCLLLMQPSQMSLLRKYQGQCRKFIQKKEMENTKMNNSAGKCKSTSKMKKSPVALGRNQKPLQAKVSLSTPDNIAKLSRILMSEASIGNDAERIAVGSTVLNRMKRKKTARVSNVWGAYAHNQAPTKEVKETARNLLNGKIADNTAGATHYYSPRTMPKEGESTEGYDVGGGLESTAGLLKRNYRPSWALTFEACPITGVRENYYRFYRAQGSGAVH